MAVGFQWSLYTAVVLFAVHAAHSPQSLQGLFCVNDFVRSVTCIWRHASLHPGSDCWISGVKINYETINNKKRPIHRVQRCKLKQNGEFPGCTFSFNKTFYFFEKMPNITVTCNGKSVDTHSNYNPQNHIKMNPPGAPNVSSSVNMTRISWNPGRPLSNLLRKFKFEVQIKPVHQSWNKVRSLPATDQEMLELRNLQGRHQVRVRVKPYDRNNSHWSDWSPVTSWMAPTTSQEKELNVDQISLFIWVTLGLILGLTAASLFVLYRCCMRKIRMREKTVPNPSKHFLHTLQSVHGGNLKKWLNPLAASSSFFVVHPAEDISAVEVCDSWDVAPSTSPCSTSALLHSPPAEPRHHHADRLSSCSSACFSNMGYFMSSYNSGSVQTRPSPYFSYQGNGSHKKLPLSLCPSLTSSSIYESLRREPQSPDSGFGIGKFEDRDLEVMDDNQRSPLLLPFGLSVTPFPPTPARPSVLNLVFDNQVLEEDAHIDASPADGGNLSAWPVAGPMCRASSLPVDSSKSGYLTLKELQTTFSNKSI